MSHSKLRYVFRPDKLRTWISSRAGKGWPIKSHLALFAGILLVPAIAFSAFLINRFDAQQRSAAYSRVEQLAADLADDVSIELERGIVILKMLGLSGELERGDIAGFHSAAKRAIEPLLDTGILLLEANGRQLANTFAPYGSELSDYAAPDALKAVVETRKPYVSNLFFGRTRGTDVVNVLVPVLENGNVRYVLVLSYSHYAMRRLIEAQQTGAHWTGRLIDRTGVVIAGSGNFASLTGRRLPPDLTSLEAGQRARRILDSQGHRVVRAVAPTRIGGWLATANVEERLLEEPANRALRDLVFVGLGLLALTSGLIVAYGQRIVRSLHDLALSAEEPSPLRPSTIDEVNQVARLLRRITGDLRESRHSLQASIDVAGMAAWGWDEMRQEKKWTPQAKAIFGLSADEDMSKQRFLEMLCPVDEPRYQRAWREALEPDGSRVYRLEYRIRRANDGAERWISSQAAVEFEGRQPVRVVGAMRDITPEKRATEELLRHSERQALLLAVTHELIGSDATEGAVAGKVFASIAAAIKSDVCLTYRMNEVTGELDLVFGNGISATEIEQIERIRSGDGLCGKVAERRSPILADAEAIALDPQAAHARRFGITAYSCHPLFARDGRVLGTFALASTTRSSLTTEEHGFLQTVTNFLALAWERIQAERQIEQREAHVRSILNNTLAFVGIVALDGTLLEANEAALTAGGIAREDVVGRKFWDCYWWSHDAFEVDRLKSAVEQVGRGESVRYDAVVRMAGNTRMTIDFMLSPARDEHGAVTFLVPSGFDITSRKQGEMQIRLLMREVNHRAKNLLAVVQSIARHTARESDPAHFVDRLTERIGGLSASQDLLVQSGWQGVELGDLVRKQLAHFSDLVGERVVLEGPQIRIKAAAAQAIGMALHELATNSGKYGALSNDVGTVRIDWEAGAGDRSEFRIGWLEAHGPPVVPPVRRGFGYVVTVRMAEHALSGKVNLEYPEEGARWQLVAPSEHILESTEEQELTADLLPESWQ